MDAIVCKASRCTRPADLFRACPCGWREAVCAVCVLAGRASLKYMKARYVEHVSLCMLAREPVFDPFRVTPLRNGSRPKTESLEDRIERLERKVG